MLGTWNIETMTDIAYNQAADKWKNTIRSRNMNHIENEPAE